MPPPRYPSGEHDPYLYLLQRIDERQERMGSTVDDIQKQLADGRVLFAEHELRISNCETRLTPDSRSHDTSKIRRAAVDRFTTGTVVKIIAAVGGAIGVVIGIVLGGKALL